MVISIESAVAPRMRSFAPSSSSPSASVPREQRKLPPFATNAAAISNKPIASRRHGSA